MTQSLYALVDYIDPEDDLEDHVTMINELRTVLSSSEGVKVEPGVKWLPRSAGYRSQVDYLSTIELTLTGQAALRLAIHAIRTWLVERNKHTAKIEIDGRSLEVSGGPIENQQKAIDAFINAIERSDQ